MSESHRTTIVASSHRSSFIKLQNDGLESDYNYTDAIGDGSNGGDATKEGDTSFKHDRSRYASDSSSINTSSSSSSDAALPLIPPPPSPSFWLIFSLLSMVLILSESSRGIVIPTLALYSTSLGGTGVFLGILVAMFSIGRLSSTFFFARFMQWSSDSSRVAHDPLATGNTHTLTGLIISLILVLVGHFMYILATSYSTVQGSLSSLVMARLLVGFGTGTLVLCRTFVAERVTEPARRAKFMAALGIEQFMGFAFTPALGAINVNAYIGTMHITIYNFGSYLLAVITMIAIAALVGTRMTLVRRNTLKQREDEAIAALEKTLPSSASSDSLSSLSTSSSFNIASMPTTSFSLAILPPSRRASIAASSASSAGSGLSNSSSGGFIGASSHRDSHAGSMLPPPPRIVPLASDGSNDSTSTDAHAHVAPTLLTHHTKPRVSISVANSVRRASPLDDDDDDDANEYVPPSVHQRLSIVAAGAAPVVALACDTASDACIVAAPVLLTKPPASLIHPFLPHLLVTANVVVRGGLSIAEAYGALLYYSVIGHGDIDEVSNGSLFFLAIGGGGVVVFAALGTIVRYCTPRWTLLWSFFIASAGFVLLVDFNGTLIDKNFVAGMVLIWSVAAPLSQTVIASELSNTITKMQVERKARKMYEQQQQMIEAEKQVNEAKDELQQQIVPCIWDVVTKSYQPVDPTSLVIVAPVIVPAKIEVLPSQATWMGYLTAAGSIGRVIFPLLGGVLYSPGDSGGIMMLCVAAHVGIGIGYIVCELRQFRLDIKAGVKWTIKKIAGRH